MTKSHQVQIVNATKVEKPGLSEGTASARPEADVCLVLTELCGWREVLGTRVGGAPGLLS